MKMKIKINIHITRILVSALAVVFAVGFAPQMGVPVFAESSEAPDISLGTQQLAEGASTDDAQTLWYGGRDWRVIAYDGKNADGNRITYQNPGGRNREPLPGRHGHCFPERCV